MRYITDNDYSQPAARNYELDRSQVILNDIIGVGQFGDVHIGVCRLLQTSIVNQLNPDNSSQKTDIDTSTNEIETEKNTIHVAVKTCKADVDLITSEKFLEEACKYSINASLEILNSKCFSIFFYRYNAKIRASAYNSIDRYMQWTSDMDCNGISTIRWTINS